MIYLTTGQPGAGKTLWTIGFVKALAEKDNRPVYYSGIADLKLPWIELEKPEDWHTVPAGSIIVIDEAQRLFRPRGVGTKVPEYVQALETHRHRGLDLFVITQHPMLIESNVRRLIGTHWHVMRVFGAQRAAVHEFNGLRQEPDKNREGSVLHQWAYPQALFDSYKSAELHTHKRRIPARVFFLVAAPVLALALGYYAWLSIASATTANTEPSPGALDSVAGEPGRRAGSTGNTPISADEYIQLHQPRVTALAYTAPRYDEINQPVSAPKPASCIKSPSRGCKCFTQQATPLDVPAAVCEQIVKGGWFDDTQDSIYRPPQGSRQQAQPVPPAREGGGVSPA